MFTPVSYGGEPPPGVKIDLRVMFGTTGIACYDCDERQDVIPLKGNSIYPVRFVRCQSCSKQYDLYTSHPVALDQIFTYASAMLDYEAELPEKAGETE